MMSVAPFLLVFIVRTSALSCSSDGVYEDKNDVGAYYKCDGNVQTYHHCPNGTVFNVNELNCTNGRSKVAQVKMSSQGDLKLVCYYINWGVYRNGIAKFEPKDIDPFLCTHIIYAFIVLDGSTLLPKLHDRWADIDLKGFERVIAVKEKNAAVRVLLAIGGWTDSAGDKYSRLVRSAANRRKFIQNIVPFLKQHKFDGFDLDWEYPVCWQVACSAGPKSDKENFAKFVKELRMAFDKETPRLLLTAAVSPSTYVGRQAYDIPSLGENLDFINVMCYDYHSSADGETGHHAPFKSTKKGHKDMGDVVRSMKFWAENGAPKRKLILGTPAYGRSFTLADRYEHGLNARTNGPGQGGGLIWESGFLLYIEILQKIKHKGWIVDRDKDSGPYAYGEGEWVGFDDPVSLKRKAQFAKDSGYGGVMIWDLAGEDKEGILSSKKYPLLNAIKEGFGATGREQGGSERPGATGGGYSGSERFGATGGRQRGSERFGAAGSGQRGQERFGVTGGGQRGSERFGAAGSGQRGQERFGATGGGQRGSERFGAAGSGQRGQERFGATGFGQRGSEGVGAMEGEEKESDLGAAGDGEATDEEEGLEVRGGGKMWRTNGLLVVSVVLLVFKNFMFSLFSVYTSL